MESEGKTGEGVSSERWTQREKTGEGVSDKGVMSA